MSGRRPQSSEDLAQGRPGPAVSATAARFLAEDASASAGTRAVVTTMVRRGELPPTTQQVFAQVLDGAALVELAEHTLDDPEAITTLLARARHPADHVVVLVRCQPPTRTGHHLPHPRQHGRQPGIDYILTQYSVGRASYGTIHTFGFGHLDNAKYPLVETRTTWPAYPVLVTERCRGWDTRK